MFLAAPGYFLTELANIFPLSWMFLTERASSTVLTCIIIDVWVVGAASLPAGLTVVFDISMLTLYLWITVRTLVLDANGIAVILAEEMRRAFVTVCLEDDLSMFRTEEVGRAFIAGILILLMRTLETFSARHACLVGSVEGSVGLFDLAARACTHCYESEWDSLKDYRKKMSRNQFCTDRFDMKGLYGSIEHIKIFQ